MKERYRILALVLALCICLTSGAFAAQTEANTGNLRFIASTADSEGYFTMTFSASDVTFRVFQVAVRFDPAQVQPVDSSGKTTDSFSDFASVDQSWLSTIGTGVDAKSGYFKFSGYIGPGVTGSVINSDTEAVAGSDGIQLFSFRFKRVGTSDPKFRIATEAEGDPYDHSLPEGVGITANADRLSGTVTFDLSALPEGTTTSSVIPPSSAKPVTAEGLIASTLVMQIGNHAAVVNGGVTAIQNGEPGIVPYIQSGTGRTYVPIRFIAQKMGAEVSWDGATRTVIITKGKNVIRMTIGQSAYTLNGTKHTMNAAAVLVPSDDKGNARTMVPVRFVAEALDYNVEWDASERMVILSDKATQWDLSSDAAKDAISQIKNLLLLYGNFV